MALFEGWQLIKFTSVWNQAQFQSVQLRNINKYYFKAVDVHVGPIFSMITEITDYLNGHLVTPITEVLYLYEY